MNLPRTGNNALLLAVIGFVVAMMAVSFAGFDQSAAYAAETEIVADAAIAGFPAPKLTAADYPSIAGINGRVAVWIVAQLHLWFAAFVLAVPIFVLIIEVIGMRTRDRRYDDMAYEFIKVSHHRLFADCNPRCGLLAFSLVLFYPHLFTYLSKIFSTSMFYYALLFFAESAALYIYYYGWHWLAGRFSQMGPSDNWPASQRNWYNINVAGQLVADLYDEPGRRGCSRRVQRQ